MTLASCQLRQPGCPLSPQVQHLRRARRLSVSQPGKEGGGLRGRGAREGDLHATVGLRPGVRSLSAAKGGSLTRRVARACRCCCGERPRRRRRRSTSVRRGGRWAQSLGAAGTRARRDSRGPSQRRERTARGRGAERTSERAHAPQRPACVRGGSLKPTCSVFVFRALVGFLSFFL